MTSTHRHAALRALVDRHRNAVPEFAHGRLSRDELDRAAGACCWLAARETGALADAWRHLADALADLATNRDGQAGACTTPPAS